ncbi:MAG TPA: ABC transporter ATP-binding protein [Solirubrobacterales bacterium]|nr:ABC transporter ATP-binding protein [Solirubrobacterales bacterium]
MDSSSTDGKATEVEAPLMEARDLFHIYRETEVETVALRGANLDLRPGSWTSLMGPSGSGKSTLVHVLAGLLEPNGGSVMFHHQDVTRLSAAERARLRRTHIGLVLQRDNLHPLLDIAGNVALPLRLDGRGAGEARERVEELLDAVGLLDWQRHAAAELSGGEAQRVALAVALAPRPQVLLADEPTGELDETTAARVLDLLDELRARGGAAILTVTHNPQVAERAQQRLIMRDGVVVDDR